MYKNGFNVDYRVNTKIWNYETTRKISEENLCDIGWRWFKEQNLKRIGKEEKLQVELHEVTKLLQSRENQENEETDYRMENTHKPQLTFVIICSEGHQQPNQIKKGETSK